MKSKVLNHLTKSSFYINLAALCLFAGIILYYNFPAGIVAFVIAAGLFFYARKHEESKRKLWKDYIENITNEFDGTLKQALINHPLPLNIIDSEGEIIWYNKNFALNFGMSDILHSKLGDMVPGFKISDVIKKDGEDGEKSMMITHDNKIYKVLATTIDPHSDSNIMVYWNDVTNYENLKIKYKDEKICTAHISVDNYEDLIAGTSNEKKSALAAQIDMIIQQWAAKYSVSLTRYETSKYYGCMENKSFEQIESTKFSLLDEIRSLETQTDFPVSLSMGIGVGGKNILQTDEYADTALDLALGRGGDQAVVKKITKIEYYGGKLQAVEKRNKGKSKIMAHALRQLIDQSPKVMIMGHQDPDMDSFGAALGVHSFVASRNREAFIVISKINDSLENIFKVAQESKAYNFISGDQALLEFSRDMLLIVVDTNRPSYTECPGLLERAEKIVVIDHHRKMEENIESSTLIYMEPYASSTSELVSEILQYGGDKKGISKLEADAMLSGITVDTKNFSIKTGVRTFEAASWLRRVGADTVNVRQYFQTDMETFRLKLEIINMSENLGNGIYISTVPGKRQFMNVITSQAADEMLDIKGVRASFVLGVNDTDKVAISARSLNEINVQIVMEKIGGGGHLTAAGAQVEGNLEDVKNRLKGIILETLQ